MKNPNSFLNSFCIAFLYIIFVDAAPDNSKMIFAMVPFFAYLIYDQFFRTNNS